MSTKPPEVIYEPPKGAVYVPLHAKREVTVYPIQEHELKTLTVLNTQVSLWCSIGSSAIALLLSCIWDMMTDSGTAAVSKQAITFSGACLLAAGVSFFLAWRFRLDRDGELAKIAKEVVPHEPKTMT